MRRILTVLTMLVLARGAGATVLVPMDLGELSRDARTIARGRVVSVDARWTDDRRTIETIVTLEPDAVLKGQAGDLVRFRVPGGLLGRFRNVVVGAPQFEVGQQVIVFLGATGPMVPYVLGLNQGVYRVERAEAAWMVVPPPILPSAGRLVRGGAGRQPSPLADFERSVRAFVESGR
jgi:hypothetical protein